MDETQKRKVGAKEFIQKHQTLGVGIGFLFLLILVVYISFVYYLSLVKQSEQETNLPANSRGAENNFSYLNLLPTFLESENSKSELDDGFLSNFRTGSTTNFGENAEGANAEEGYDTKLTKIENMPVAGYTVFDKSISIKNYIKNKPQICTEKTEPELKKDTKSIGVEVFQKTLGSIKEYEDTPTTGTLDQKTRDKIYLFQQKYADVLYKSKAAKSGDKTPTRVIDKETAHFLNLLCNLEKENSDDFVPVPTLRYVLKENSEIYDYNSVTKEKVRIESGKATSTDEIVFSPKGDHIVYRKAKNDIIYSDLYTVRTRNIQKLPENISSLSFSSSGLLAYGVPTENGLSIYTHDYAKNASSKLFSIPLNEWDLLWQSERELGIYSKPTAFAEGIYMTLDIQNKKLKKIAGPLLGLSVQNTNTANFTILSTGGVGEVKTLLLNSKTKNLGDLGLKTFAEKCSPSIFADGVFCAVPKVLPANFVYPDDWYKGKIRTEDAIIFKTISGTSTKVISYLENKPISIINLEVNKNGIFFLDENTMSLYSLEI